MQSALLREEELGILRPDGTGVHDGVDVIGQVGRVVPDMDRRAELGEFPERVAVGAIRSGHSDAALQEHPRQPRHAGTADADEVCSLDPLGDREGEVGSDHDPTILGRAGPPALPGALGGC